MLTFFLVFKLGVESLLQLLLVNCSTCSTHVVSYLTAVTYPLYLFMVFQWARIAFDHLSL